MIALDDRIWDQGVRWFTRRVAEADTLPLTVAYVRDQVLKVTNGDAEDAYITSLIQSATRAAEHATHRAIQPQTLAIVMSTFPASGWVELPRPPAQSIVSVEVSDRAGARTPLDPAAFVFVPGGDYQPGAVFPASAWPSVSGPITITYRAGFVEPSAELDLIRQGIAVHISEAYKQRSLSVEGTSVTPSVLRLIDFWRPWR